MNEFTKAASNAPHPQPNFFYSKDPTDNEMRGAVWAVSEVKS